MVSEYLRFFVGSCVNTKSIGGCLAEIVCRSRSSIGTVCGIMCQSKKRVWIARGIKIGGVDHSKTLLGFHFEIKILSLSSF